jgi:glyoxylate/hydroxypyruvate reductase A
MELILCGDLPPDERAQWLAALSAAYPPGRWLDDEAARRHPERVRAAVVFPPLPPACLQGWPNLGLIQCLWAGVDRLLEDPWLPADVPLARMVDPAMGRTMAQTALWAALSLQRDFFAYARQQARREWRPLPQRRAESWRVSVLGHGEMGRSVSDLLVRLGYAVAVWTAGPREAPAGVRMAHGEGGLQALLPQTDLLVNLLPLTPATRGLLDARLFAALPPGASLLNLARGAHVVDADLLAALDAGHLLHAVLDVFTTEPLPPEHPYWTHPRVTVLPHVGAVTDPQTAAGVVAANLRALADGRPLQHLVDRRRGY